MFKLQQYLPFTVLKLPMAKANYDEKLLKLQQYLPFTVLKLPATTITLPFTSVATVLTVYGIETVDALVCCVETVGCNSTYRLRY